MQKIPGVHFKWFWAFFAFGAGLTFALGYYVEFHALSNDYWNILYYGRRMTLSEPASLYNGFYPFGYALLIGQMPFTYILPLSYLLNALLTGLFTASVSTLILSARSVPATILAFYSSIAAPFVFQNANTLSPDIGAAAFTAFAVFLLWRNRLEKNLNGSSRTEPLSASRIANPTCITPAREGYGEKPYKISVDSVRSVVKSFWRNTGSLNDLLSISIGVSLGLSFLWRTHAAVSILAILTAYFLLFGIRPFRPRLFLLGALAVAAGLQVIVNLVSGHGALETGQAFNLYKFFHGVDWTHPPAPAEVEGFSLVKTVAADPARAFDLYKPFFLYFISHAWAAALAFLLSPKGRFARFSLFSLLFIILYAVPISLSDSARSPVILMSVYLPSVSILLIVLSDLAKRYVHAGRRVEWAAAILFVTAGFQTYSGWAVYDIGLIRAASAERRVLSAIEQTLHSNGMTSPSEVFADRYDFYTPNTMPYRSRQIGNWSGGWVWGYNEEFPPIPNDSWESFYAACKEQGIRFLVLSQNSHYRGGIFPPIYNDEVDLDALGLRFLGQRGRMRLYEIQ